MNGKNSKLTPIPPPATGGLTPVQLLAADLMVSGKTDAEAALELNVNRGSVARWRMYSPEFKAALAVRRADLRASVSGRLQNLIPKALDTLADAFDHAPLEDRCRLALNLLKLTGTKPAEAGPTDPEDYVRELVKLERIRLQDEADDPADHFYGLPDFAEHCEDIREKLAALSSADDESEPSATGETLNPPSPDTPQSDCDDSPSPVTGGKGV